MFHPGTSPAPEPRVRVAVVADVVGALTQIHANEGTPKERRQHGRVTPRHVFVGFDGTASLVHVKEPFGKLLPPQPDLGYLAPELLRGASAASMASDVFGAGVLLWEALDNGRLFPHRQTKSMLRLIERRALPRPRIAEEWALPLVQIAMRALSLDPEERYADATAMWRELRRHVPPRDETMAELSAAIQGLLRLRLTDQIRDEPPYWVPPSPIRSLRPTTSDVRSLIPGQLSSPPQARYSIRPEPSTFDRVMSPGSPESRRASTRPSAPRAVKRPASGKRLRKRPEATAFGSPAGAPALERERRAQATATAPWGPGPEPTPPEPTAVEPTAAEPSPLPTSQPPSETDSSGARADASLPFLLSGPVAPPSFPWGLVTLAALAFFGVGAAVAFWAVSALRPPSVPVSYPPSSAMGAPAGGIPAPPRSHLSAAVTSAPRAGESSSAAAEETSGAEPAEPVDGKSEASIGAGAPEAAAVGAEPPGDDTRPEPVEHDPAAVALPTEAKPPPAPRRRAPPPSMADLKPKVVPGKVAVRTEAPPRPSAPQPPAAPEEGDLPFSATPF